MSRFSSLRAIRFSLKTLFAVFTIIATFLGLFAYNAAWMRERNVLREEWFAKWAAIPGENLPSDEQLEVSKATNPQRAPGLLWIFREPPLIQYNVILDEGADCVPKREASLQKIHHICRIFPEAHISVQVRQPDGKFKSWHDW
jgi:hypothetical protein